MRWPCLRYAFRAQAAIDMKLNPNNGTMAIMCSRSIGASSLHMTAIAKQTGKCAEPALKSSNSRRRIGPRARRRALLELSDCARPHFERVKGDGRMRIVSALDGNALLKR